MRILPIAAAGTLLAFSVLAQGQPACQAEIGEVQKSLAETPMPAAKETQVKALLEQVVRACKENNEVVAAAGLDQVKAIIKEQKKGGA
jgi:hypothetical protein